MIVKNCCDECDDGNGNSIYPSYGVGPHICGWRMGKPVIGYSKGLPKNGWPVNFIPDEEYEELEDDRPILGVWTHCLKCQGGKNDLRTKG